MSHARPLMLAVATVALLCGCGSEPVTDEDPPDEPEPPAGPEDIVSRWEPADVVVFVLVDTLARHTLQGWQDQFETNPAIDAFFDDATLLPDVLAVRGVTAPATASILTGTYPRKHAMRSNDGELTELTLLAERFHDAGYYTMGYAANLCPFIDRGIDDRVCTWKQELDFGGPQSGRDRLLMEELLAGLDDRPPVQPLFLWLHLMNPHHPYELIEPWYSEYHPEPYEGDFDPGDIDQAYEAILGEIPFDDADRAHLLAAYMSGVRETDLMVRDLFDDLQARGLYDEAVIVLGVDHGEALGIRDSSLFHGCPMFNEVLAVPLAIRAPDRLPLGAVREGWISQVDIGPTVADVAGIGWSGDRDGISRVDEILDGELQPRDIFTERRAETLGLISGQTKYVRDDSTGSYSCPPWSRDHPYPVVLDSLFDLATDPGELDNLAEADPALTEQMHAVLCDWLASEPWVPDDELEDNRLLNACGLEE